MLLYLTSLILIQNESILIISIHFESVKRFLGGYMKFNERLRQLRQNSSLMQKEIAESIGISTITLRQYEQGTREPNIEKLMKLAIIFDVSLDDLLCLEDFKDSLSTSVD